MNWRPERWIRDRYESLVCDANCRDYHCKVAAYADTEVAFRAWNAMSLSIRARIRRGHGQPVSKVVLSLATCSDAMTYEHSAVAPAGKPAGVFQQL